MLIYLRLFWMAALLSLAGCATSTTSPAPGTSVAEPGSSFVIAANPLAADAGMNVLRRGGSAVDAAIAAQLVLGLVEPQSSGIGGGGFMLVHDAKRSKLIAYDGRETAPAAANPDRFLDRDGKPLQFLNAVVGGRSVGVPGTVALLEAAHKQHGRLPWRVLFEPAITLADQGFIVSPRLVAMLAAQGDFGRPAAQRYFARDDGGPLRTGDVLRNVAYARTLSRIAADGARAFYEGEIARDIVATVAGDANRGDLTLADLAGYRVSVREPVCGSYRRHRVCGMPLPSSGGPTVLQILAFLEPYNLASMGANSFWSTHFIAEAGRLAYADRGAYMADPAFAPPPAGLLDADYLRARGQAISPMSSIGRAQPGSPPAARKAAVHDGIELPSTSHLSVVDRYGNAVAFTTTIENAFGSRLFTEGGFLLNNELTDFSFAPSEGGVPIANRVQGGKRPRSSMAPTIVYDPKGSVYIVTGSPGGSAIINYVVKNVVALLDWKLDPQAAAALPNVGSRNGPTELEKGTANEALAGKLTALGHDVRVIDQTSGVHTIVRTSRGWVGGADPRREGIVRGD